MNTKKCDDSEAMVIRYAEIFIWWGDNLTSMLKDMNVQQ